MVTGPDFFKDLESRLIGFDGASGVVVLFAQVRQGFFGRIASGESLFVFLLEYGQILPGLRECFLGAGGGVESRIAFRAGAFLFVAHAGITFVKSFAFGLLAFECAIDLAFLAQVFHVRALALVEFGAVVGVLFLGLGC